MSLDIANEKSTLVQVMAWCHQATSHYLSQCWHRSLLPYGITRLQWVTSVRWWTKCVSNFACQIASLYNIPYSTPLTGSVRQPSFKIRQVRNNNPNNASDCHCKYLSHPSAPLPLARDSMCPVPHRNEILGASVISMTRQNLGCASFIIRERLYPITAWSNSVCQFQPST